MTSSAPESRIIVTRMIILSRSGENVLLARTDDGWRLPTVRTQGHWHAEVSPMIKAVEAAFEITLTAVRCLSWEQGDDIADAVWLMHANDGDLQDEAFARWATLQEARRISPVNVDLATESVAGDETAVGASWLRPNFWARMLGWVLEQFGGGHAGLVEQIRHWSITSIWRIPMEYGDLWFKAVPPMFAIEGTLIRMLASTAPDSVPRVIATDHALGYTLMEPLPPNTLRERPDAGVADESMRVLARLQRAWIGRSDELLAAGCPDRRLDALAGAVDELLERPDLRGRFSDAEAAALTAFGREVPERIEELRACGVPETLMHGDFHPGNVAYDGDHVVIFDWTDGCVSHPFFDLATFLPQDPVERAALSQAYLSAWEGVASPEQIERAWELSEPLARLHHAVSYMRILDNIDPGDRWEFDSDVAFWLHWLRDLAVVE